LHKLLIHLNDACIQKTIEFAHYVSYTRIERYLGFLEASEPILELSASLVAGKQGKWIVVAAVQTLKYFM